MDIITTAVTPITLDAGKIVHAVKADFTERRFPPTVKIVQYDKSLPVIAASLYQGGAVYTIPTGAAVNIRVRKPDCTYVYNGAIGCDTERHVAYFEVSEQMAAAYGDGRATVELVVNGEIAGTSLILLQIEENPVQEDAIESSDEYQTIYDLYDQIKTSIVSPASTAAEMTDTDLVYLYIGNESGYNKGHLYYYNGSAWVDAGIAATDKTLNITNMAADGKATGDAIATLKSTAVTTKYQDATAIPNNTDYNTLTTPGNYYCSSSASAKTMTNIPPITTAHRLIVLTRNSGSTITQILIASNSASTMYIRNNAAAWHKVAVDIDTLMTDSSFRSSATTAPASDFNDLEPGTIYTLGSAAVEVMANAPKGSLNVAGADQTYGIPSGTVVTFRGGGNGAAQIFFAQSGSPYSQPIINIRHKYYSNSTWQWTPWAQLATLYGVLRATNTFIQESRIQAGTADFTDMDDAPNNTIYQIDLDAVSMAHNPISGRSCVLITFSPSFISNHGSMQLCAGLETDDAYTPQMYYRYGYRQSSAEFRWTTWIKLAGDSGQVFMENKGQLAKNTDLDTVMDNSVYLLAANGNHNSNPIAGYAGFMTVKTKDTISMQTVERLNGERHTRYTTNGGTSWSSWT